MDFDNQTKITNFSNSYKIAGSIGRGTARETAHL